MFDVWVSRYMMVALLIVNRMLEAKSFTEYAKMQVSVIWNLQITVSMLIYVGFERIFHFLNDFVLSFEKCTFDKCTWMICNLKSMLVVF